VITLIPVLPELAISASITDGGISRGSGLFLSHQVLKSSVPTVNPLASDLFEALAYNSAITWKFRGGILSSVCSE
jgi:hypothetical protein